MRSEPEVGGPVLGGVIALLVSQYRALADRCYRVAVSQHDERGRFRQRHRARSPHPVLLKKIDLDRDLARLYYKFFGPAAISVEPKPISTSNSRLQGSDTRAAPASAVQSGISKER
jgi:hypothetical protein